MKLGGALNMIADRCEKSRIGTFQISTEKNGDVLETRIRVRLSAVCDAGMLNVERKWSWYMIGSAYDAEAMLNADLDALFDTFNRACNLPAPPG